MVYRKATYDEYQKATEFAKFRYKFGVYIQLVAVILFLILTFYTIINIEEMKTNPVKYAEENMDVICIYGMYIPSTVDVEINYTNDLNNTTKIEL